MPINKKLLVLVASVSALAGCNSEDATVTSSGTAGGSGGPAFVQAAQNAQREARNETTLTNVALGRGVFSLISTDLEGTPTAIAGLGFLSASSRTRQAFTFHFDNADLPYDAAVFTPTAAGVLYAWRSGPKESTLGLLDPRSRQTKGVGSFGGTRIATLSSPDMSTRAWTDRKGDAWVSFGDVARISKLNLDGATASGIQVNARTHDILVTTAGATQGNAAFLVFSAEQLSAPKLRLAGQSPAESPDGAKLAYVQDQQGRSKIAVLDKASNATRSYDVAGLARGLRWRDDQRTIGYQLTAPDGTASLRLLDTASGADTELVPLHLAGAEALDDSIVCPAWNGADVFYFADVENGRHSIYRATRAASGWIVELFTSPSAEMSGYICPKILRSGT